MKHLHSRKYLAEHHLNVGSAAFNLFCISGVCVMAIPDNEV